MGLVCGPFLRFLPPTMYCRFCLLILLLAFSHLVQSFTLMLQRRIKKRQFKPHYRHHCRIDPLDKQGGIGVDRLCNLHDYAYVGPVSVGEPEQILWMDFDTGSADSWIMTNDCKTRTCLAYPRFDPRLSSTFQTGNDRLKFVYGLGDTMQGYRAQDNLCIGTLCVQGMDFAAATSVNQGNTFMDGLIGLAYPSLSIFQSSFIGRLKHQLNQPIFSVWLNRNTDMLQEGGEVTFGYTNPNRYIGQIYYLPVVNQTFWTIDVDEVNLRYPTRDGGLERVHGCAGRCRAIIDTATSFIIGPSNVTSNMIDKWSSEKLIYLDEHNKWSVDCRTLHKLPDLIFLLGRRTYTLTPEDYTLAEDAFAPCDRKLAIDGHVKNVEFWVLGGAFIGRYYSVFDFGKNRVGLAQSAKTNVNASRASGVSDQKLGLVE